MTEQDSLFSGPVEANETHLGGLEGNKHRDKKMKTAGGPVGKAIVARVKGRETGQVAVREVSDTTSCTLFDIVSGHTEVGAEFAIDEAQGYLPLKRHGFDHRAIKHLVGQHVDGKGHTNGMENFWSLLNRACRCKYYWISHKHLDRYVAEFQHHHHKRPLDTIDQMGRMAKRMYYKRLTYEQLIGDGVHAYRTMEEIAA